MKSLGKVRSEASKQKPFTEIDMTETQPHEPIGFKYLVVGFEKQGLSGKYWPLDTQQERSDWCESIGPLWSVAVQLANGQKVIFKSKEATK